MWKLAVVVLLASCAAGSSQAPSFNERVVGLIATYPDRGFGGYAWPSQEGANGTSRDLHIGDEVIAHGKSGNHCVGMTFEVYWRVLESCGEIGAVFHADSARAFRERWYVADRGGAGAVEALALFQLGTPVALADAKPGDFVQAWTRDRTKGHSAVFLGWNRDASGQVIAMRYWSSQPWTEGIGVSEMPLGDAGWDPAQIYIARARCR